MRKKIVSIAIASAMLLAMAGCGANPAPAEVTPEAEETVTVAEPSEEELEAQKEAEEAAKKAEEEAAKAAEEEAAKKAEEERIAALRAEIDAIDTEALIAEMTENGNTDGVNALTSLVESYTAGETDPDAFMESYKAILADKEAFDAEYAAEQEAKAAEEAKKAEESKPEEEAKPAETKSTVTIPDWFDAAYYAANNADVVAALGSSPEALYNHYTAHGKGEGRAAYEGDPNARSVADANTNTSENSSQAQSTTGDWWDGLPWHEWIDLGDCFVYIDCHRPAPGICPDELNYNATDGMIAELKNRGYSTACSGSNHYKGVELAVVTPWEGDNGFYAPWW